MPIIVPRILNTFDLGETYAAKKKNFQYALSTAIITYNLMGLVLLFTILIYIDCNTSSSPFSSEYCPLPLANYFIPLFVFTIGSVVSIWIGWRWERHIRRVEEKDEIIKILRLEIARLKQDPNYSAKCVAAQKPVNTDSPVKSAGNEENHEVQEEKDGK
jgi:hypothetical protein